MLVATIISSGHCTPDWTHGVPITSARLRNKIRETILPAFVDSLQATDFKTFCEWFKGGGVANREWVKITEDTEPFPGVTQHF